MSSCQDSRAFSDLFSLRFSPCSIKSKREVKPANSFFWEQALEVMTRQPSEDDEQKPHWEAEEGNNTDTSIDANNNNKVNTALSLALPPNALTYPPVRRHNAMCSLTTG
jgi:hypothetical protein